MKVYSPLRSLQGRLLIASVVILPLVLLIAGLALSRAYQYSLESAIEKRLQLQVYLLLGAIDLKREHIQFPERLTEPRYDQPQSGLYAAIHNQNGDILWRSLSSISLSEKWLIKAAARKLRQGEPEFVYLEDERLFRYQLRIIWAIQQEERSLLFSVMESSEPFMDDMKRYNETLILWMSIIFLVALLAQTLIMRWGLMPLRKLAKDLKLIESGESSQLSDHYPDEVQPVTRNLNGLLESERQQRERYRNTMADLAHSLKTPLAVIRGARQEALDLPAYQTLVDEQIARMDQIVQYQLSRAVKSQGKPLGNTIPIKPAVKRLLTALSKVYRDKAITPSVTIADGLTFPGDERDLMELLGNILENAFKYGHSQVDVKVAETADFLEIRISDDGPGVPSELRQVILKRGERLDTSIQGQGIGLSVVTDIISSYQGEIEVIDSTLGGSCFVIRFPV